ncbi:MAG: Stealth CR1 domain-containing protein [Rickettsiales bacterium]|jgi:hypothetical protein|nr:Stealth CR1 domain-containing protein [Rickettsiales bacterium]
MKIDLVYLWVDGDDPKWKAKKDAALASAGRPIPAHSTNQARFVEHDELKYSLRSAEKFAPWINHIYIVTDDQRPKWLADNPKVTVVDHKDIVPAELLPTFNSNMLEYFIQNIPGLAEHFLYANDDMFFGRPVDPGFFFDKKGDPIVIMGTRRWRDAYYKKGRAAAERRGVFFQSTANALKYAYDKTGVKFYQRYRHAIEPIRKSYRVELVNSDYDYFARTTFTPFREKTKIQRIVLNFLDNAKGRNTLVKKFMIGNERVPFDKRFFSIARFFRVVLAFFSGKLRSCNTNMDSVARHLKNMPETFCVNGTTPLNSFSWNLPAMRKLLPEKSKFEK